MVNLLPNLAPKKEPDYLVLFEVCDIIAAVVTAFPGNCDESTCYTKYKRDKKWYNQDIKDISCILISNVAI